MVLQSLVELGASIFISINSNGGREGNISSNFLLVFGFFFPPKVRGNQKEKGMAITVFSAYMWASERGCAEVPSDS